MSGQRRDRPFAALVRGQAGQGDASSGEPDAIADRGYFSSDRENAGITVTLPKPMTSDIIAKGRFGKQDFRYVAEEDIYI